MRSPAMTMPRDLAVRCPYCVTGYEFRIMQSNEHTHICQTCGHMARPNDTWFHCYCPNCLHLHKEK
jgi:hypothetical protein